MKAICVHAAGGPDVLAYEEMPQPLPKPREAVVKIETAGINFIDVAQRNGPLKAPLPFIPGQEAAGIVLAVGDDVADVKVGDRVAWALVGGAYAEYSAVPADRLVKLPRRIAAKQAAAMLLQGLTAHYLACSTYPLKVGDTCLVFGAAGGVGQCLTQIARHRGARVIGAVSSDAKIEAARAAGADAVVVYKQRDFDIEVKRLTDGRGVQVVYDSVGQATFAKGLDCLAMRGTMALFGQSSGAVSPVDPQVLLQKGSLFLTRPTLGHHIAGSELQQRAAELFGWIEAGRLCLPVTGEFKLQDAIEAHKRFESSDRTGKILFVM
jgi:NADPH2:quinone reductase